MSGAAPITKVYLDVDVDGHQQAYERACAFVNATNLRYGWSSKILSELGGSEKARVPESYASDFDWGAEKGRIEMEPAKHIRIVLQLYTDVAPNCCANFAHIAIGDKGKAKGSGLPLHYTGSHFHRMVPGAILQGGDFAHSNGSGGESIWGGRFKDEKGPDTHTHTHTHLPRPHEHLPHLRSFLVRPTHSFLCAFLLLCLLPSVRVQLR